MPSYILCAFRAAILLQNACDYTIYIYICICLYLFKAAEDFSNHISEQFALIFFDLVWCSCGAACTYFELKKKFKTIVMHAETHKHVNVSWCFDYVCGANLNWLYTYIYMFCTLIYAPYSICSADRICRLTCRRKKKNEVIRENKLVHILSDGYLVYMYIYIYIMIVCRGLPTKTALTGARLVLCVIQYGNWKFSVYNTSTLW